MGKDLPARCSRGPVAALLLGAGLLVLGVAPSAFAQDLGSEEQRENGRENYGKYCAQCHGDNGDGNGYATLRVKPQPRDFTSGKYKFRTTPSGKLPTDDDIRRVIQDGLPYTSMPGWPNFTDQEVQNLIYFLKAFASDFENLEMYGEPIEIGQPLPSTEESIARGTQLYEEQGCASCHGEVGRGNGLSAPTLTDDWENHVRAVDMTQRWTFRGGPTKEDIYRTFSTGVNGTGMPSYADVLEPEDRWHLVNYVYSLGDSDIPDYATLLVVPFVDEELDFEKADELFAGARKARFPLIGQITEPGRNFYPSATSIEVEALYNRKEIVFRLRWNDLKGESSGSNDPTTVVPVWDEDNATGDAGGGDDFFGDEAAGDDFFGDEVAEEEDFFGESAEDDFFGGGDTGGGSESGFSDAVSLQFPSTLPSGNKKPYFLFGDSTSSVDLWFVDTAKSIVAQYVGRGSDNLELIEGDDFEVASNYDQGRWTVLVKRSLKAVSGVSIGQAQYTPIALSVWDGFNRERGNKRALSSWVYFYTEPVEVVSPLGPTVRAGILTLIFEVLLILFIRRRFKAGQAEVGELAGGSAATA